MKHKQRMTVDRSMPHKVTSLEKAIFRHLIDRLLLELGRWQLHVGVWVNRPTYISGPFNYLYVCNYHNSLRCLVRLDSGQVVLTMEELGSKSELLRVELANPEVLELVLKHLVSTIGEYWVGRAQVLGCYRPDAGWLG